MLLFGDQHDVLRPTGDSVESHHPVRPKRAMSNPADPFEFMKNLWGQMGMPGFGAPGASGPAMPAFSPEELAKRIAELKQVRQWLEMNLNMLNMQVNGLEMQLNAINSFKSSPGGEFAAAAVDAMRGATSPSAPSAPPFPFGTANFAAPVWAQPANDSAETSAPAKSPPVAPWPDPAAWMQTLQSEFVKNMQAAAPKAIAKKSAAPRKSAARKAPARKPRG